MIEERTLADGTVVGFDTKTNSYCNLDYKEPVDELTAIEKMTIEELREYAAINGIDISLASTKKAILKEIEQAQG